MTTNERDNGAELVLGTVQLGLPYGVANRTGMPDGAQAEAILTAARAGGVRSFDTARAYGESEARLGAAFPAAMAEDLRIVTKLDPLAGLGPETPGTAAIAAAADSIASSMRALGRTRLDVVLLHRAAHRRLWGGAVWDALRKHRDGGRIGALGVSVATPAEALEAFADPDVRLVQLPFNALDGRWVTAGVPAAARTRADLEIHARSTLLQGLLADDPAIRWPVVAPETEAGLRADLREAAAGAGYATVADFAIAHARAQDWIDGVVIGVETRAQLDSHLARWRTPPGPVARQPAFSVEIPERLLDPARWGEAPLTRR